MNISTTYGLTPALEETAQDLLDEYADRIAYRTAGQRQYQATYTAARIIVDLKGIRRKKKPASEATDGGGI